jgi:phospholipase/lecithinase/hemolysin
MRHLILAPTVLAVASLAACGGDHSHGDDAPATPGYTRQITFGDSLSDVGSYAVGAIRQAGGGKFTINGDSAAKDPALTGKVWVEVLAGTLGVAAPCAAQTGLQGRADQGLSVPVQDRAGCFNYAMGGARVTNPTGPGNAATGSPLGALTIPVTTQVDRPLARSGGGFEAGDIVFVLAGGNDALTLLRSVRASATAAASKAGAAEGARAAARTFAGTLASLLGAGAADPADATQRIAAAIDTAAHTGASDEGIVSAAVSAAAAQPGNAAVASSRVFQPLAAKARVTAKAAADASGLAAGRKAANDVIAANASAVIAQMAAAGTELAAIVNDRIVGRGATRVVVNNLPDLATSPGVAPLDEPVRQLVEAMVDAFNEALASRVAGNASILYVDLRALSREHVLNPARHGLTNTSTPACGTNLLEGSSLVCTADNLVARDVARYMFADEVHPTPFEHALIARHVAERLAQRGWIRRERLPAMQGAAGASNRASLSYIVQAPIRH